MMQLILTNPTAVAAGGNIIPGLDFNTNTNILSYNAATGEITFLQPGIYKVIANVVFTATDAGLNTIFGFSGSNNANVPGLTASSTTAAAAAAATYSMAKDVRIGPAAVGQNARINLRSLTAGTLNNVVIVVDKVR